MAVNPQLFKGSLNTIILNLLHEKGKMYGYEITKKVFEISKGQFQLTEGALYPALHKMETEGLLDVTVEMADNRPRKYYSITKKGKKESLFKLNELKQFITQMQAFLQLKHA